MANSQVALPDDAVDVQHSVSLPQDAVDVSHLTEPPNPYLTPHGVEMARKAGMTPAGEQPLYEKEKAQTVGHGLHDAIVDTISGLFDTAKRVVKGPQDVKDQIAAAVMGPLGPLVKDMVAAHADTAQKAYQALREGRYTEAAGYAGATALPGVGPWAAGVGEKAGGTNPQFDEKGNVVAPGKPPDPAGAAGDAVAAIAAPEIAKRLPDIPGIPVVPKAAVEANPARAGAISFAEQEGIPISAANRTGNKAVRNAQGFVANAPGGASVAEAAAANTRKAMGETGTKLAEQVGPEATPETAGGSVVKSLAAAKAEHAAGASAAYKRLAEIEQDPANVKTIQTGTTQVPLGIVDQNGTPLMKTVPKTEQVSLPVDMAAAKATLQPIYDRLIQDMPLAQQQASQGLKALKNVLDGPDLLSASVAEDNLGAVKAILRENVNDRTKFIARQALNSMAPAIEQAVSAAGPEALNALREGRQLTKAKYATQRTIDKLPTEPVQLFNKLTSQKDANINLLRDVSTQAPDAMPAVGRAALEGLMEKALNPEGKPGPQTALSLWNKLGDNTKAILLKDPALIKRLDDFFNLAKIEAENPNPSGTAYVAQAGAHVASLVPGVGLLITHPAIGASVLGSQALYVISNRALAKLLYNPTGSGLLMKGLKIPIPSNATTAAALHAGQLSNQLLKMAGKDAKPVQLPKAAENEQPREETLTATASPGSTEQPPLESFERP